MIRLRQLTTATFFTFVVIGIATRRAPQESASDRLTLKVALVTLCVLTLAVVASALYRMSLYQEAYGYTTLRVLVDGFELWLGLLLVLMVVAVVRGRATWLPRAALLSGALSYRLRPENPTGVARATSTASSRRELTPPPRHVGRTRPRHLEARDTQAPGCSGADEYDAGRDESSQEHLARPRL